MALPWTPDELSFVAESNVMVNIAPHFSSQKMQLMSGSFGPFVAGRNVRVPMWLALFLSSSQSCTIIAPKWLNKSSLTKMIAHEQTDRDTLGKVPAFYMEEGFAFFARSPSSVKDVDQVRTMIEDLWMRRVEKVRRSIVSTIPDAYDWIHLENVTRMELHMFREPIAKITELLMTLKSMDGV